jgi:hypothetical protein
MDSVFEALGAELEAENARREAIKEAVKQLEAAMRSAQNHVMSIHSNIAEMDVITQRAIEALALCEPSFAILKASFEPEKYFKYNDHWRFTIQVCGFFFLFFSFLFFFFFFSANS